MPVDLISLSPSQISSDTSFGMSDTSIPSPLECHCSMAYPKITRLEFNIDTSLRTVFHKPVLWLTLADMTLDTRWMPSSSWIWNADAPHTLTCRTRSDLYLTHRLELCQPPFSLFCWY